MNKSIDLTNHIIEALQDKKGRNITILDFSDIESAPASKFIIAEGKSVSQVGALADNVREELQKKAGVKPYNYDGYRNSQWIIIDYGDIMVHVFQPETRSFYNIEELWNDAKITEIENID